MLCGCEIWGHENLNIIEKLHLKSLKYIFHLNRSTMSSQVFGESGFYPISLDVKVRMIGFWADLVNPSVEKIASKMYKICHNLYCTGEYKSPWLSDIRKKYWLIWVLNSFGKRIHLPVRLPCVI